MIKNPWKKLSSKIVYSNRWLSVREDQVIRPDGGKGIYSVVESPSTVYIIALDNTSKLCLIGQHRYPTNMFSWEVPSGSSNNQNLFTAAKRELKEETGLEAKIWKTVGTFQALNGFGTEIGYVFIAKDLIQTSSHKQEEEGITSIKIVSLKAAFSLIKSGEISDAQTITALTLVALKIGQMVY